MNSREPASQRRRLAWSLSITFVIALLMGPGPGLLLANRPVAWLGMPALYLWCVIWYLVMVAVVVIAYRCLWTDHEDSTRHG